MLDLSQVPWYRPVGVVAGFVCILVGAKIGGRLGIAMMGIGIFTEFLAAGWIHF